MTSKKDIKVTKYFAAANSYNGFISYFDEIFSPLTYDRLYILKGGPGCGKSSFMKKVAARYKSFGCGIEEIYCSSDPNSLDGVIISRKNKSIAIIDGTAPHERDTKIPGAADELIDLSQGWDKRFLIAQRQDIESLINEKSKAYNTAYNYLHFAGKEADFIKRILTSHFDRSRAKSEAEYLLNGFTEENVPYSYARLISSFGRYGKYNLSDHAEPELRLIRVGGESLAAYLFISYINKILEQRRFSTIRFPSPLDPGLTETIYFTRQGVGIIYSEGGEINADELFPISPTESARIKLAQTHYTENLGEAKRWFAIASEMHMQLEKIYGEAMDFSVNDRIFNEKCVEIDSLLETSG